MQDVTNKQEESSFKPKCVTDHNNKMEGVDKVDQDLVAYKQLTKQISEKYYKNIFFNLLYLAL